MTKQIEHTPGPWESDSDGHIYREPRADEVGPHICRVNLLREDADANARLIAETPTLLTDADANQRIMDCAAGVIADLLSGEDRPDAAAVMDALTGRAMYTRASIARARGQEG